MSLPPRIGDYEVVRQLGLGPMGPVYLGTHENQYWALRAIDEDRVRLVPAVGQLLGDVQHDSLVRYKEIGTDGQLGSFLSTDYIDGKSLTRDLIAGLGSQGRIGFLCQILEGIVWLHGQGTTHGCIKTSNVIYRKSGKQVHALVIDAGLVYVPSAQEAGRLLARVYPSMAPELVAAYATADRKAIDGALTPAADVYAAAVLVAEVLSGRRLFVDARDPEELIERKHQGAVRLAGVNAVHRHASLADLDRAVVAATSPDPAARPALTAFLQALRDAAEPPAEDAA